MIPKVGQLLRWYDNSPRFDSGIEIRDPHHDVGIVKEVRPYRQDDDEDGAVREWDVIIDWCKGPHHSFHSDEEYLTSIENGEIVVVR